MGIARFLNGCLACPGWAAAKSVGTKQKFRGIFKWIPRRRGYPRLPTEREKNLCRRVCRSIVVLHRYRICFCSALVGELAIELRYTGIEKCLGVG
jgi:hypothetical protein